MHITKISQRLGAIGLAILIVGCGGHSGGGGAPGPADGGERFKPAEPLPDYLYGMVIDQGVPVPVAQAAFANYDRFRSKIRNGSHISMIDFTQHSKNPRLFVVNVTSGNVDKIPVAHGTGSDPNNDGYAEYFSNVPNSKRSSLGSYLISEKYSGKYGTAMKTDGLESGNDLVRKRNIVIHGSKYVSESRSKQGLSWGCPAVPFAWIGKLIERLRNGSFMYVYGVNKASSAMDAAEIERIMMDPTFHWLDESEDAPEDGE
jgi:L,D-transpeptidase catalytic domain